MFPLTSEAIKGTPSLLRGVFNYIILYWVKESPRKYEDITKLMHALLDPTRSEV